ncbi:MAG: hypothetical protein ACM34E_11460 [Acidobacteriota bacterium]
MEVEYVGTRTDARARESRRNSIHRVSRRPVSGGLGWIRRRYWGWVLGVSVIGINLAGDITHFFLGDRLKSGVGVVIASLLLFYMTREKVRGYFLEQYRLAQ